MMRLVSWGLLVGIFLISGYGLNMIRVAVTEQVTDPSAVIWWRVLIGLVLSLGGFSFLGGFVYHREKKRGKVGKPAWMKKKDPLQ